jgi:hypothetical protein
MRMTSNLKRLGVDATLDEIVDAGMRLVQHTAAYRRQRTQYQWIVGACAAGGVAVPVLRGHELPSLPLLAIMFFAAVVVGVGCGGLYGAYHNQHVRLNYRKLIQEMYGGAEQIRCEFELTDDGLSGKSVHSQMSFPWSRLTRVADVPGSIELWFDPGLVVIRDRAFQTQEERRNFLDSVREHLTA